MVTSSLCALPRQADFSAFLTGPLQRNALCNLLSFTYKVDQGRETSSFSARLLYEDLTATLPTDVAVTCAGTRKNRVLQFKQMEGTV